MRSGPVQVGPGKTERPGEQRAGRSEERKEEEGGRCGESAARAGPGEGKGPGCGSQGALTGWAEGCRAGRPPAPHGCSSSVVWGWCEPGILVPAGQLGVAIGSTPQPRPGGPWQQHRAKGHRATWGKGPSAGGLDSGWGFLAPSPVPFGRGHPRRSQSV